MALYGFSLSLPTIVRNMGFTAADAQGLSAPPYIFASFCVVASGFFSDRYRLRAATVAIPSLVAFMWVDTPAHTLRAGANLLQRCFNLLPDGTSPKPGCAFL